MKNKKVIITLVVLVVAIGAYLGVTKLQKDLNRQALDSSTTIVKEEKKENNKEEKKEEVTENNIKPSEEKKAEPQAKKEIQQNKDEKKKEEVKNNNTKQTVQSSTNQVENTTNNKPVENKVANFLVTDSINGKTIVSGHISIQDGETAENATERFLRDNGISFKNKDGYISRIGDIKERDKGPKSGWCYYINGVKATVGMTNMTLKSSDKIEWRYLEDGVNN